MTKLLKGLYAAGLGVVLMASAATTEAADLKCAIPFAFSVNDRALPAGIYDVTIEQGVLTVKGYNDGAYVLVNRLESTTNRSSSSSSTSSRRLRAVPGVVGRVRPPASALPARVAARRCRVERRARRDPAAVVPGPGTAIPWRRLEGNGPSGCRRFRFSRDGRAASACSR